MAETGRRTHTQEVLGRHAFTVERAISDAPLLSALNGPLQGVPTRVVVLCKGFLPAPTVGVVPPSLRAAWEALRTAFAARYPTKVLEPSGTLSTVTASVGTRTVTLPLNVWAVVESLCTAAHPRDAVATASGVPDADRIVGTLRAAGLVGGTDAALSVIGTGEDVVLHTPLTDAAPVAAPDEPAEDAAVRAKVVAAACARLLKQHKALSLADLALHAARLKARVTAEEVAAAAAYLVKQDYAEWSDARQQRLVYVP